MEKERKKEKRWKKNSVIVQWGGSLGLMRRHEMGPMKVLLFSFSSSRPISNNFDFFSFNDTILH